MSKSRSIVAVLAGLLTAGGAAMADDGATTAEAVAPRPEIETTSTLAVASPPPRWTANVVADEIGAYRLSVQRGSLDLGMRFEPRLAAALPADARHDSAAPAGASLPSLSLGLRSVAPGTAPAGNLVQRALGSPESLGEVKKIGIEWKPSRSQVFFNRGVGFRLNGEDRIVMRLKKSSIGIYMQRKF